MMDALLNLARDPAAQSSLLCLLVVGVWRLDRRLVRLDRRVVRVETDLFGPEGVKE